jgi:hypothetical protein
MKVLKLKVCLNLPKFTSTLLLEYFSRSQVNVSVFLSSFNAQVYASLSTEPQNVFGIKQLRKQLELETIEELS